jgi:hypothetical protein
MRLYTIGKSVQNRDLWVMEVTDNPGQHELGEQHLPQFLHYNMHPLNFTQIQEKAAYKALPGY